VTFAVPPFASKLDADDESVAWQRVVVGAVVTLVVEELPHALAAIVSKNSRASARRMAHLHARSAPATINRGSREESGVGCSAADFVRDDRLCE
jgi:hypothetical protein